MKDHILNRLKGKFVVSLILYKTASILKKKLYDYKDTVHTMDRVLYYIIQRKFQLGRLVIVIVVTPLNLYYT